MNTSADAIGDLGTEYKGRTMAEISKPFIDEVNAQGGINGRKVVPAYTGFNPASADSMLAACVEQAEDKKVFAALALVGFYGEGEVCMANKQTPTLSPSNSAEYTLYDREQGWVRQTSMNKDRGLRNWIDWMAQSRTAVPGHQDRADLHRRARGPVRRREDRAPVPRGRRASTSPRSRCSRCPRSTPWSARPSGPPSTSRPTASSWCCR